MEFSLRKINDAQMKQFESDVESSIQIVFTPSGFNPELWKNQLRYFSRKYRTTSFRPMKSQRGYEGEFDCLKNLLDSEKYNNTVVVSHNLGNSLTRKIESHESVVATVNTGLFRDKIKTPPRLFYRGSWKALCSAPKLTRKLFFSDLTEYGVVRSFSRTLEKPDYRHIKSFIENYRMEKPVKNSLIIHASKDRFSSLEHARSFRPSADISVIENAGSFCFWEKPQEFNKALNDYLRNLEDFVEGRELVRLKKKNRSLRDFENNRERLKKRLKVER
jgi:hypothetical protein